MEKLKVGVVFGGRSGEHEVSIRSAKTVIEQIDKEKYDVLPLAITKEGNWLNPFDSLALMPPETRELLAEQIENFSRGAVALLGDTNYKGLTKLDSDGKNEQLAKLDVIFPVLH